MKLRQFHHLGEHQPDPHALVFERVPQLDGQARIALNLARVLQIPIAVPEFKQR